MTLATHQAYKTYTDLGIDPPVSPQGTSMPAGYPVESTIRPANADNIAALTAEGYRFKTLEEWKTFQPSFHGHQYFQDLADADAARRATQARMAKVERRKNRGALLATKIIARLDEVNDALFGDDELSGDIATWKAAGDTHEQLRTKIRSAVAVEENGFADLDVLMRAVMAKLSVGSLRLALKILLAAEDSIPEAMQSIFEEFADLIADGIAESY